MHALFNRFRVLLGLDALQDYRDSEEELQQSTLTLRRRTEELEDTLTRVTRAEVETAKGLGQLGQKYGRRATDK